MPERAGVLFVRSGLSVQRAVYREHGFGYWSAAFDLILEKHGWLDLDTAEPEVLARPDELRRYDAVLIAWIPEQFWRPGYARGLESYDGVVFAEGPLPARLAELAGLEPEDGPQHDGGRLVVADTYAEAVSRLRHLAPEPLTLAPVRITTRSRSPRAAPDELDPRARAATAYALAYRKRFEQTGRLFPDPYDDALATLAWVRFVAKLPPGRSRRESEELARRMLEAEHPEGSEEARAAWTVVLAEAGTLDARYESAARERLAEEPEEASLEAAAWWAVARQQLGLPVNREIPLRSGLPPIRVVWMCAAAGLPAGRDELERLDRALADEHGLPELLEGRNVLELLLFAAALERSGHPDVGGRLFDACLEEAFDADNGAIRNATVEGARIEAGGRPTMSPLAALVLLDRLSEIPLSDTPDAAQEISEQQVSAWGRAPYAIAPYRLAGAEAVVSLEDGRPILVRRGRILASAFQLLGAVVHTHTAPPLDGPLDEMERSAAPVLEHLLLELIAETMERHGRFSLQVAPWPADSGYCLSIRHDVDRIPDGPMLERLLALERAHSVPASWCWLADRLDSARIEQIEREGHEIALHARSVRDKERELEALGRPVAGETLHGATDADFWLGYPSVREAVAAGLGYTELCPSVLDLPYGGFPRLERDGSIERDRIMGITQTFSTDGGGRETVVLAQPEDPDCLETLRRHAGAGLLCQVLNHPDMNVERLEEWLGEVPARRVAWTAAEIARWWRTTHARDGLEIRRLEDTQTELRFRVLAAEDVEDLDLRLGEERFRLSLRGGEPGEISLSRRRQPRYEEVVAALQQVGTVNPNPDYQVLRASRMAEAVARFTPIRDLASCRVGDVGCGYGPFTLAFHLGERPQETVALDAEASFVEEGRRLVRELGVDGVTFVQADMARTDEAVEDADLLIVNNSINYLTTRRRYREAIASFWRALRPGGAIVILTPNRLYPREAFTRLIGVQWMPKPLANAYVRRRGRRETYEDIRLPSPFELVRWLRRAGFTDIHVVDAFSFDTASTRRFFKPRFYVTAVKPKAARLQ